MVPLELGCLAWWEPSKHPGWAARKKLHHGEKAGFDEVEIEERSLAWGAFSQALLGRPLKVTHQLQTKGFQTQRAQPGRCQAWLGI